jgi:hypothetical protein
MKLHQYNYIAKPSEPSEVLAWFRSLDHKVVEVQSSQGLLLHFSELGDLKRDASGSVIGAQSPVALLRLPEVRRGNLWTVGEVKFLPAAISRDFRKLYDISRNFKKWLSSRELIFSHRGQHDFNYYLEGGSRNFSLEIYAFESGMLAIRSGRYFVSHMDGDQRLSALCRQLRLRGVECADA